MDKEQIKAIRHKLGLTQREFSALLGLSPRTCESWEQGTRKPMPETAERIRGLV